MASLGVYIGTEAPGPRGQEILSQPAAVIQLEIQPKSVIAARMQERPNTVTFPRHRNVSELAIGTGDLMFAARSEWEINDILCRNREDPTQLDEEFIERYIEYDKSPFAVFNGLKKPASMRDARLMYKFCGILHSGPADMDADLNLIDISVVSAGVVPYLNKLDTPIAAGTQMTWMIDDPAYTRGLQLSREHLAGITKRRHYDLPQIRGMFVPAIVKTLRDDLLETGLEAFLDNTPYYAGMAASSTASPVATAAIENAKKDAPLVVDGRVMPRAAHLGANTYGDITSLDKERIAGVRGLVDRYLGVRVTEPLRDEIAKIKRTLLTDGNPAVADLAFMFERVASRQAAATYCYQQSIVGINTTEVGPNQWGQILLQPR